MKHKRDHRFLEFAKFVESHGLIPCWCARGHWQIRGGSYTVNYYPHADKGPTFYINGMSGGRNARNLSEVIAAASKPRNQDGAPRKKSYRGVKRRLWWASPHCRLCGRALTLAEATVDHVIPLGRGGSNGTDNLTLVCVSCNHDKDCKLPTEYTSTVIR